MILSAPPQDSRFWKRAAGLCLLLACGTAHAADDVVSAPEVNERDADAIKAYWTQERMNDAIPRDLPGVPISEEEIEDGVAGYESPGPIGKPGYVPGWAPGSGPAPDPLDRITLSADDENVAAWDMLMYDIMGEIAPLTHGSTNFDPDDPMGYGPFHRHTHFGRYLTYPISTIGKLFFTIDGQNYVCSGSVIGRSTVATAGHCISDGDGEFATNVLFCPSYRKGGPQGSGEVHPDRGCWASTTMTTATKWHSERNFDYDHACIVTQNNGDTLNAKIGSVTGWTGRAWNWSVRHHQIASGYPAGNPFPGYHIISCNGVEWYDQQRSGSSDNQRSKYIGCDMTGGSSGGPWWFGLRHPNWHFNYDDTDGSNITAPFVGSAMINGVNSHSRCKCPGGGQECCYTPPDSDGGTYWQEMGSPVFQDDDVPGSSERVFEICLDHGNNDP